MLDPVKTQWLEQMRSLPRSVPVTAPGPIQMSDITTKLHFDDDLSLHPDEPSGDGSLVEIVFEVRPGVATRKGTWSTSVTRLDMDPMVKCWRDGWSWAAASAADVTSSYAYRLAPTDADLWKALSDAIRAGQVTPETARNAHRLRLFARRRLACPASESTAFAAEVGKALVAYLNRVR